MPLAAMSRATPIVNLACMSFPALILTKLRILTIFFRDRDPWWDATSDLKLIITHGDMVWKLGSRVAGNLASQSGWFRNAMRDLPVVRHILSLQTATLGY